MPDAPVVVTDQDVLTVIDEDDAIAHAVEAAMTSLGAKVPPAMALAWASDRDRYFAWAVPAREALSGGFFFGQWFGVPDAYNTAANWGATLKRHADDAARLGADLPSLPTPPPPATPVHAPDLSLGADTKVLIGLALIAAIVVARRL